MTNLDDVVILFKKIGLDEKKAQETSKNTKLSPTLLRVIKEANVDEIGGCAKSIGVLLYILSSTIPQEISSKTHVIAPYIKKQDLKSEAQIQAAYQYILNNGDSFNEEEFKKHCGVGVVISDSELANFVKIAMEQNFETLQSKKYKFYGAFLKLVKAMPELKWAEGSRVKEVVDIALTALLGSREEVEALEKQKQKEEALKKQELKTAPVAAAPLEEPESDEWEFKGEMSALHKPGGNKQIRQEIMEKHLKETGGKIITRFPPEPNGYLHLGHAKAINIDFRYAFQNGGECNLRFDDTNPEAEDPIFFDEIQNNLKWLGFAPTRITHSSDYFDQLYKYAVELIKKDKAYICHQTPEEIKISRGGDDHHGARTQSPWRNRPIAESLKIFEDMKNGKVKEGEAILRMKTDINSGNPTMWDIVAYRVLNQPHARTGTKWCIYPTYDFAHPLCDSLENITHSFCSKEFVLNREFYYWLCDALEVYKPVQWEFERLNVTHAVLSKRKVLKLIQDKVVFAWNDPRLYTLNGLKRRGFTAPAINNFVKSLGVSTAESTIEVEKLEAFVRKDLNLTSRRIMCVLNPLKVKIIDYPGDETEEVNVPNFPNDESKGFHKVPFSRVIYIDRNDFRVDGGAPGYKRLAPGKTVGLLFSPHAISCTDFKVNEHNEVIEVSAICDYGAAKKQKKQNTYIHWVAESEKYRSPIHCEVRLIDHLFLKDENQEYKKLNPNSLKVIENAYVSIGARNAQPYDKFQFFREGFFCVDTDSTKDKLVFNRTVGLNEDPLKQVQSQPIKE